jgi:hypothetical protein
LRHDEQSSRLGRESLKNGVPKMACNGKFPNKASHGMKRRAHGY